MKRWNIIIFLVSMLLSGCVMPDRTDSLEAQATARVGGCWPYGVLQPVIPPTIPIRTATMPTVTNAPTTATPYSGPWPSCTPIPGTPTVTPRPTPWNTMVPPETPQPPGSVPPPSGGLIEIGDQPGNTTNEVISINPHTAKAVVGWISWGWSADENADGNVWIRVQQPTGDWGMAQTLNSTPVNKGRGGLGITVTPNEQIVAVWSPGPYVSDEHIYLMKSSDHGETWSERDPIPGIQGTVISLSSDEAGGLHLLWMAHSSDGEDRWLEYAYQPAQGLWQVSGRLLGSSHSWGRMALLERPDGTLRRFIGVVDASVGVVVLSSNDGSTWRQTVVESGRFMTEESRQNPSIVAVHRSAGDVVALVWSQYSLPGVFAAVSVDGGVTWGREERIAQRDAPRNQEDQRYGCCGSGYFPSVVYDQGSDQLAIAWRQRDFTTGLWRTMLSARPLEPEHLTLPNWKYAVVEEAEPLAPALSDFGWSGRLVGSSDGTTHWLLMLDQRNRQNRLSVRPINLAGYLVEGDS